MSGRQTKGLCVFSLGRFRKALGKDGGTVHGVLGSDR